MLITSTPRKLCWIRLHWKPLKCRGWEWDFCMRLRLVAWQRAAHELSGRWLGRRRRAPGASPTGQQAGFFSKEIGWVRGWYGCKLLLQSPSFLFWFEDIKDLGCLIIFISYLYLIHIFFLITSAIWSDWFGSDLIRINWIGL